MSSKKLLCSPLNSRPAPNHAIFHFRYSVYQDYCLFHSQQPIRYSDCNIFYSMFAIYFDNFQTFISLYLPYRRKDSPQIMDHATWAFYRTHTTA